MVSNFFTSLLTSALPFYGRLRSENIKIMINTLRPVSFPKDTVIDDPAVQLNGLAILRTGVVHIIAKRSGEAPITVEAIKNNSVLYPVETITANGREYRLVFNILEDSEFFMVPNSLYKTLSDKEELIAEFNETVIAEEYGRWEYVIEQIADYNAVSQIAGWVMQTYSKKRTVTIPEFLSQCSKDTGIEEYLVQLILDDLMEQGILHKRHNTEIIEISTRNGLMSLMK